MTINAEENRFEGASAPNAGLIVLGEYHHQLQKSILVRLLGTTVFTGVASATHSTSLGESPWSNRGVMV